MGQEQVPYWGAQDDGGAQDASGFQGVAAGDAGGAAADLATREDVGRLEQQVRQVSEGVASLNDLFTRRLYDDRQKRQLIEALGAQASFAAVEPFLHDLILLLDRVERAEGDFAESVADELLDLLERRDVRQIHVGRDFDPNLYKVVKAVEQPGIERNQVVGIVRNGYVFGEKVIRPAEVVLARPVASAPGQQEQ